MAFLEWDQKYSVHIDVIDKQHKRLIQYINELHDAIVSGKSREVLGELLKQLIAYSKMHYRAEESHLGRDGYPRLAELMFEHRELTKKVLVFLEKYIISPRLSYGGLIPLVSDSDLMDFLRIWFVGHLERCEKLASVSPVRKVAGRSFDFGPSLVHGSRSLFSPYSN